MSATLRVTCFIWIACYASGIIAADDATISGQLVDLQGKPAKDSNVFVFITLSDTGYPLVGETKEPLFSSRAEGIDALWHVVTDEQGKFRFEGVPAGNYRLVGVSWPDIGMIPTPKSEDSTRVRLHGVAEDVRVEGDKQFEVKVKQLGNGVLSITNDPKENHAFIVISRNSMLGDPILGPMGWGKKFLNGAIGISLMEDVHVTIEGLPDNQKVHIGLFNYDNNPGIGGGTYMVGQDRNVRMPIYATWSNGKYDPPERLLKLVEHFEKENISAMELIGKESMEYDKLIKMLENDPPPTVDVKGFGKVPLADALAADGYKRLREFHKKRRQRQPQPAVRQDDIQ